MSPLYDIKSKRKLANLLYIQFPDEYNTLSTLYNNTPEKCYIPFTKNGRDLLKLKPKTKRIHTRLYKLLLKSNLPNYIKSGRKNSSYLTNATEHQDGEYFFFVDIQNFYPSITFDKIKKTLIIDYGQSANVATFLANLVTIQQKKSKGKRALVTGSPLSQNFSFFINKRMFEKLEKLANSYGITMSIYVDDISFSSKTTIPFSFIQAVHAILKSHDFELAKGTNKYYRGRPGIKAEVTGIKITKYGLFITEKRKDKIREKIQKFKKTPNSDICKSIFAAIEQAKLVNKKYVKYERLLKNSLKF